MEVNELLTRKNQLEVDITLAVRSLCADFINDTGVHIDSIYVNVVQIEEHGREHARHFVEGTSVTLDL